MVSRATKGGIAFGWRAPFGRTGLLHVAISAIVGLLSVPSASAQTATACRDAGTLAEVAAGLPSGLMLAVGQVESGRWDTKLQRVLPWPWVIDVAGQPRFFSDKSAAIQTTRALLQTGQHNIDVGCFQISLLHHPFAFPNLNQAFDPTANAAYAARFLVSLHTRYGNWADAVAAYHSADPTLGVPYRNLVFAAWRPNLVDLALPLTTPVPSVHVWTPGLPGTAPQVIRINAAHPAQPLPRIISPAH